MQTKYASCKIHGRCEIIVIFKPISLTFCGASQRLYFYTNMEKLAVIPVFIV